MSFPPVVSLWLGFKGAEQGSKLDVFVFVFDEDTLCYCQRVTRCNGTTCVCWLRNLLGLFPDFPYLTF